MIAEWFAKQVIHHSWTNVGKIFYFICVFLFCLFLSELPLAHSNTWSVPAHRFNTSNDWKWLIGVYWKRKNSKTPRQSLPFQHKYIFIISGRNTCTAITTIHCHCPMLPEIDPLSRCCTNLTAVLGGISTDLPICHSEFVLFYFPHYVCCFCLILCIAERLFVSSSMPCAMSISVPLFTAYICRLIIYHANNRYIGMYVCKIVNWWYYTLAHMCISNIGLCLLLQSIALPQLRGQLFAHGTLSRFPRWRRSVNLIHKVA